MTKKWINACAAMLCGAGLMAASALVSTQAVAQSFPSKPLNMVVSWPAGGASDQVGRMFAQYMPPALGQPMMVENIVGVNGSLGVMKVVNAAPDGHTVIAGSPLELILGPLALQAAKNKPTDIRMLALAGNTSMALVTRKDFGANSFADFVTMAKAAKADKPLNYGSAGVGGLYHLMGEKFTQLTGAKTNHVPFPGLAPMMTALVGGHIDFLFAPIAGPVPGMIDNGAVKALAVSSANVIPRFSALPTMRSQRGFEDFVFTIWAGLHTSAKVPDAQAEALSKAAYSAILNPDFRKTLEASGMNVSPSAMSLKDLDAFYSRETNMYQNLAKSINLQAQ